MAFYSYNRFRLVVLLLLVLIFWQIFHLIQPPASQQTETKDPSNIEMLEDSIYNKHKIDKVGVKVYYEALCPDSRHFFLHHLQPVSEKLADFLNITLIPYGKATTNKRGDKYTFECQHGEVECYANKIHACAIDNLRDMTKAVSFTNCMISENVDPDGALERCGKEMRVETEPITDCAKGDRGSVLLKDYGEMTHAIDITFIPMISLNDSLDHQAMILKKFLLVVCQKIAMPLPPPCL